MFDEPTDDGPDWCDFCETGGHDIVECEAREAWHRERPIPTPPSGSIPSVAIPSDTCETGRAVFAPGTSSMVTVAEDIPVPVSVRI